MSDAKLFFIDTNLLVYARDGSETEKQPVAARWMEFIWKSRRGRISYQVLNEYYNTVTRKLSPGRPVSLARQDIQMLQSWGPISTTNVTMDWAWRIQDEFSLSWWDSLIIAAALETGCSYLVSEDMQENLRIEELRIINPFKIAPESL